MRKNIITIFIFAILLSLIYSQSVFSSGEDQPQAPDTDKELSQAIWHYKHEEYEEAYEILKKLRKERPDSSLVAYYLGITCKQMQVYTEAKSELEAAVQLKPHIKNALIELIDLLYKKGELKEALKWIEIAEKESIHPPQVAFFKGLVLLKEGEDMDQAVKSLEEAKELDDSITDSADYYIGLAYVKAKKVKEAKEIFRKVAQEEGATSLADFAKEYIDAINQKEEAARPIRGDVGAALQYDSNVVLKPSGATLASDIGNAGDWRQVYTADIEYNYKPVDVFAAKIEYSLYVAKQFDLGFYDTLSHNLSAQPSFYLGNAAITFPFYYNHVNINDKNYLDTVSVGNLDNIKIGTNQMGQFAFIWRKENYTWPATQPGDDRDSDEYFWHVAWFGFFAENKGLVHMKYTVNYDDTEGENWRYVGNKFTLATTVPLSQKLKLAASLDAFFQKFLETNLIYSQRRFDSILTVSSSAIYEVFKNTELQLNYTYVDDVSNIGIYKYNRNIYSMGMVYRF